MLAETRPTLDADYDAHVPAVSVAPILEAVTRSEWNADLW